MSTIALHERTNFLLDRLLSIIAGGSAGTSALEVTQLNVLATLNSMLTALKDFQESVWTDDSNTFFIRRTTLTESAGVYVISYILPDGTPYVPTTGLRPVSIDKDIETKETRYVVVNAGTGYSISDIISKIDFYNVLVTPAVLLSTIYFNETTNSVVTPLFADLDVYTDSLLATAANQVISNATISSILDNSVSKINRIKGSNDYVRLFVYDNPAINGSNVTEITHSGTTVFGVETIVETITYVNPAVINSNVLSVTYS